MQFIYKIPGYILILFGGFCLSWGGFIVRLFETSNAWETKLIEGSVEKEGSFAFTNTTCTAIVNLVRSVHIGIGLRCLP